MAFKEKIMIIYFHIPKTGGTSFSDQLKKYPERIITEGHHLYRNSPKFPHYINDLYSFNVSKSEHIRYVLGADIYDSSWKTAIVRNPWDRYVSNWKWLTRKDAPNKGWTSRGWKGEEGNITFDDFVRQMGQCYSSSTKPHPYQHDKWHIRNQIEHITDKDGNIMVDHIGRFEDLNSEFDLICEKAGIDCNLPYLNHTGHYSAQPKKHDPVKIPYSEYYNQELIDIVAERCKEDIDRFGYDYE